MTTKGQDPPVASSLFDVEARAFMEAAFSRNLGILTPQEQEKLFLSRVAVPGLGGVGGLHCMTLARLGVGSFHLADPDAYELANFNRQFGATVRHLGESKLSSMVEEIRQINPRASLTSFHDGLTPDNLDEFLSGVNVVVDGLDFSAFNIRRMLFNRAREMGIPVVTAAPLGYTASLLVFAPDSMTFDDYFDNRPGLSERERLLRFAVGLAPSGLHLGQIDPAKVDLARGRGPSLAVACLLCAALAATETVRLLGGRPGLKTAPWSLQVDLATGRSKWSRPRRGNASASQRLKLWYVRNVLLAGMSEATRGVPSTPVGVTAGQAPTPDQLGWLEQAARQAPSGDNCQPWRIQRTENGLSIRLDPSRDGSFFNFRQLASVIACGAAVQNVVSSAPDTGLRALFELLPDPADRDCMAEIRLEPSVAVPDVLSETVWTRCTNRRPYFRRSVDSYSVKRLVESAEPSRLIVVHDPKRLRELAGLVYLADRIRVERRDLHEHFTSMTRFTPPDGAGHDDGLPLKNLHAGAAGEAFLRLTRPWWAMRVANTVGLGRLVALHSRLGMLSSPLAGLLCAEQADVEGFLKGGMGMERVWLMATRLGLALQPMTAITLFWLRWRLEGPDAFSKAHRTLLEKVWQGFEKLFPELGAACWPVMLFRAGHARPISQGTPRRLREP
ncbi:tRNA threonylcarbamoyladenosine dehydratase [Fundidesulfovibrio magnetotacticus]|uniref:tRNA threonylcarbamoyladenosine dehydratase n=1 Tax=Fundidesulfovibrio magnetotacticus TaxID=2730080 RepID=A0A6V8LQA6_9BACT|nr:ThiF family adenylyltransferase [Fundidesulfovibrio magnetotacticus]GFK93914.1 tRNA threonylcarbamoyladenosine dehydratase [Fundidesulfovibrio magnetotacticus]